MPEEVIQGVSLEPSIESPADAPAPGAPEPDESEPEGVVEVQGRRMVDVSVLAAERRRAREIAERGVREREVAPLQQQAQDAAQLREALAAARPYVELVRQHPELLQAPEPLPLEQQISDEEALAEARDLELYEAGTGQLDVTRARRIIAKRRTEAYEAAQQVAQSVVAPHARQTATAASGQNFAWAAGQRDAAGQPLVDHRLLAELWAPFHQQAPELAADPQVAEVLLDAAIGRQLRLHQRGSPGREPIYSEAAGGRPQGTFPINDVGRKLAKAAGMTEKQFHEAGKGYNPTGTSVIGE